MHVWLSNMPALKLRNTHSLCMHATSHATCTAQQLNQCCHRHLHYQNIWHRNIVWLRNTTCAQPHPLVALQHWHRMTSTAQLNAQYVLISACAFPSTLKASSN